MTWTSSWGWQVVYPIFCWGLKVTPSKRWWWWWWLKDFWSINSTSWIFCRWFQNLQVFYLWKMTCIDDNTGCFENTPFMRRWYMQSVQLCSSVWLKVGWQDYKYRTISTKILASDPFDGLFSWWFLGISYTLYMSTHEYISKLQAHPPKKHRHPKCVNQKNDMWFESPSFGTLDPKLQPEIHYFDLQGKQRKQMGIISPRIRDRKTNKNSLSFTNG